MLDAYVSDETYAALSDVLIDIERNDELVTTCRSSVSGRIQADLTAARYTFRLMKAGYGSKSVQMDVSPGKVLHFRLLSEVLIGYMWPKWNTSGNKSEFRVNSPEPYRMSLWRYGLRKEFIALLGWFDEHGPRAALQITPDGDYSQTGVGWNKIGFPPSAHTQQVIAPQQSGLYYLHAETQSGKFSSFPWVVAPRSPSSPIAVLASTNTWNAYNAFGGRSNYLCPGGLQAKPTVNARQDLPRFRGGPREWSKDNSIYPPLSFDRPEPFNGVLPDEEAEQPMRGRMSSSLAPADWRLLAWLEREGWTYDYYSDYQLHVGQLDLDAYRVLILTCHPEYWSREMYQRVKQWVYYRGGRLVYLGGNGINCEIQFVDDTRMVCLTHLRAEGGALGMWDPDRQGIWYESRFHYTVECEANLLGVATTSTGLMTSAPYRVIDPHHWAFEGTGLKENDLFGFRSLHERCSHGASGHETDKMCAASPEGTLLLAKGINPDQGGSHMVYYERQHGGAVFSVGSITYPACLLVDETISKITNNVLGRFTEHRFPAISAEAVQSPGGEIVS